MGSLKHLHVCAFCSRKSTSLDTVHVCLLRSYETVPSSHPCLARNRLYAYLVISCVLLRTSGPDRVEKAMLGTESLKMVFRDCSPDNIVQFLKQTSLFDKL